MKKESLEKRSKDIERELEALKGFRLTPQLRKFQRTLIGEQSFVKGEIARLKSTGGQKEQRHADRIKLANKNRSEKMKRTWRYLRAIRDNYPVDIPLRQLRTALRKHRQGLETDIPDVAWRNPSP
ncbi:conserved protein of unknown function [Nitrosotalea devaniterrae]|uniref:Uncharacterized protein n=1 Tax=Nitrosotalea devaniterrae TaxID=1078905 RepID=A0A128A3W5_9ARCH|nr:conserved protein of unknown function [Candidatus Nitrosotalea devanaterra]